ARRPHMPRRPAVGRRAPAGGEQQRQQRSPEARHALTLSRPGAPINLSASPSAWATSMSVGTVAKLEGRTSTLSAAREGARRLVPLLALLCVVPGILHVVVVCRVVLGRLGHRVDLEWMERDRKSTRLNSSHVK